MLKVAGFEALGFTLSTFTVNVFELATERDVLAPHHFTPPPCSERTESWLRASSITPMRFQARAADVVCHAPLMRIVAITTAAMISACGAKPEPTPSHIDLVTSPGSTLFDRIERFELIAWHGPSILYEATRDADGLRFSFDIAYDIADWEVTHEIQMFVRGFDASGALIASGRSPKSLRSREDRRMTIYVAPPLSIGEAPVRLRSARTELGTTSHRFGALIAGGRDASGVVSDVVEFYDLQYHSVTTGTMPVRRAGATLTGNWLFGGTGPEGVPTASLYQVNRAEDATMLDAFTYENYGEYPGLERTGQRAIGIQSQVIFTGDVAAGIEYQDEPPYSRVVARADLGPLTTRIAEFYDGYDAVAAVLETGSLKLFESGMTTTRVLPAVRDGAAIVTSGRTFAIVGGAETSAFTIDATDPNAPFRTQANVLEAPRYDPTVASTRDYVLVVGGVDAGGIPIATAEILEAETLKHLATVPIAPRTRVTALTLPNEQIALIGGDQPSNLIELFTPPTPDDYYFCTPYCTRVGYDAVAP